MKGAVVLETVRAYVPSVRIGETADGQRYLELTVARVVLGASLPHFRASFPLSPKTIANLETMGVTVDADGDGSPAARTNVRTFLIDLVSVPCSDEETHGTEANRLFVRNPRKV